jgi:hypothetical protein
MPPSAPAHMPSLIIDVRPGERLALAGPQQAVVATVELVQKSGRLVRLRVTAPPDVRIERERTQPSSSMLPVETSMAA